MLMVVSITCKDTDHKYPVSDNLRDPAVYVSI